MTMKLEVGKSYRTRDGRKATIQLDGDSALWKFGKLVSKIPSGEPTRLHSWRTDGGHYFHADNPSPLDLIAEWDEPTKEQAMLNRVEVWGAKKSENVARFKLVKRGRELMLVAVNERGDGLDGGEILSLSTAGVRLCGSINPAIGLPLDSLGRVKVIQ